MFARKRRNRSLLAASRTTVVDLPPILHDTRPQPLLDQPQESWIPNPVLEKLRRSHP